MHEELKDGPEGLRDDDGSAESEDEENGFDDRVIHDGRRYCEGKVCALVGWLVGLRIGGMEMICPFYCGYRQLLYRSTLVKIILEVGSNDVRQSLNNSRNTMNKTTVLDIHVLIT